MPVTWRDEIVGLYGSRGKYHRFRLISGVVIPDGFIIGEAYLGKTKLSKKLEDAIVLEMLKSHGRIRTDRTTVTAERGSLAGTFPTYIFVSGSVRPCDILMELGD